MKITKCKYTILQMVDMYRHKPNISIDRKKAIRSRSNSIS